MVKYFLVAAALVATLAVADLAEARGRRGCSSCNVGGGCPGGVCAMPVAPGKMAVAGDAPPAIVADASAPAPVATVAPAPGAPRYASTSRRGLFGWRR
jgi:hypothetical protein